MSSSGNTEGPQVSVVCTSDELMADAASCSQALGLEVNTSYSTPYTLTFSSSGVGLYLSANTKKEVIRVDFCKGKEAHRRIYGGGKGQMIAKAVGISSKHKPSVFDATAGLGKDAFVLASLGCKVTLMERSPVAYALLNDDLNRALRFSVESDPDLLRVLERMTLKGGDSISYLAASTSSVADVVYLDPMFPARQKKAAVKKDMTAFHGVVGQDLDNEALFASAENKAVYRIAVKRSRHAPCISSSKPTYSLEGKSSRYDIYTYKGMT